MTAPNVSALTITSIFTGGAAPAGTTGTGTLQNIFAFAANQWMGLIPDSHSLTLNFGWGNLGGPTIGLHTLTDQDGTPNRETSANLTFDNSNRANFWFLDGTPGNNSEYTTGPTTTAADLGGGLMTTGIKFTGATGAAAEQTDLLSVVLHEIGHSLGLSSDNTSFTAENGDLDVDVTSGLFAGAVIPTVSGAHLNLENSLMFPATSGNTRTLISKADLMANCQISQFNVCLFVPEPASVLLFGSGLAGLAAWRWMKREKRHLR